MTEPKLPKLNEQQVEMMLKLALIQKNDLLAKLKKIEDLPDDGTHDKVALMAAVLNPTGANG